MSDDLARRFEGWVHDAVASGEVWIVVDATEANLTYEDPDADRDLECLFLTEADARKETERSLHAGKGVSPSALEVDDLPGIAERVEARGSGFALHLDGRWFAVEPDLLREELLVYAEPDGNERA